MLNIPDSRGAVESPSESAFGRRRIGPALAVTCVVAIWATNRKVAWVVRGALLALAVLAEREWHVAEQQRRQSMRERFEWKKLGSDGSRDIDRALTIWLDDMDHRPHFRPPERREEEEKSFVGLQNDSENGLMEVTLRDSRDADEEQKIKDTVMLRDTAAAWRNQVALMQKHLARIQPKREASVGALWADGRLQAVILVAVAKVDIDRSFYGPQTPDFEVLALVTAPWNLARDLTDETPGRRAGSATSLLRHTMKLLAEMNEKKFGITVPSPPSCSHGFLRDKLGFEQRSGYDALSPEGVEELCSPKEEQRL